MPRNSSPASIESDNGNNGNAGLADRSVLAITAYEALKERILDGIVAPGERLNMDALTVDLNVSQTPIREALARLSAERLVTFEPYKGYTVSSLPSSRSLSELIHVRKLLEGDAVRLAVARMSPITLSAIERVVTEMSNLSPRPYFKEYRTFTDLDQQFHELIMNEADNAMLLDLYRSLHVQILNARFFRKRGHIEVQETVNEHQTILQAFVARDSEAAAQAMLIHIDKAYVRALSPSPHPAKPAAKPRAAQLHPKANGR